MDKRLWPGYENNPFFDAESSDGRNYTVVGIDKQSNVSRGNNLCAIAESEAVSSSTAECNKFTKMDRQKSRSSSSDEDLNVNSCSSLVPHKKVQSSEVLNDSNELADIDFRENCRSCPVSSDFDRCHSPLNSHMLMLERLPSEFHRMNSSVTGQRSLTKHGQNFTQSLPDLSSIDIINENTVDVIETSECTEEVPSVICQDNEISSTQQPSPYACCDWIRNTTKQEKLILLSLFLVDFTSQMCLSIMAPFFPQEAESKGVSNSVSGWVFGVFALVQFIASPIFGKLLPIVGSRFLITAGQFFSSGCVILFGVLDYVEPEQEDTFIALCFVLRIALAIGCTAANTASFAVTAICFPNSISTIFGLLETATGMGMMLGPALGGFLNQIGGYILSFAVLGGFMLLTVPLNLFCLPANDCLPSRSGTFTMRRMLQIPAIIVVNLGVIMAAIVWSVLDPTLSVNLNSEFNLSSVLMGLLFLLMSSIYAVSAPIWGRFADSMNDSLPLMVGGFALSAVGLMLLGPSPFLSIDDGQLWLVIVSLTVLGASVSLALVPTFDKILEVMEKAGFKDDLTVYGFVAGIWGSCFAFGDFLGPALGGWLMDSQGFAWTMTYTAFACIAMAVVILGYILYERKFQKREEETNGCSNSDLPSSETSDAEIGISEETPLLNPENQRQSAESFA